VADDFTEPKVTFTERKASNMSGVAKASELLDEMYSMWPGRVSFKDAVRRATDAVNKAGRAAGYLRSPIKHSRIEDLWRQEARRVDAEELDAIRAAHNGLLMRDARDQHQQMLARIERIEAALRLSSADALRALVGDQIKQLGGVDRAVDRQT